MRWLPAVPLLLATSLAFAEPGIQPALKSQPSIAAGVPTLLRVPGDKPIRVVHAPLENQRALIYLHGWCGRPEGADPWLSAALAHGTLIALTAEVGCPNGRTRWGKRPIDTDRQHERIQRALAIVKAARGGALDIGDPIVFGYSQGAARAYRLAQRYPRFYQRLVLGGPPEAPSMHWLSQARAMAVLGGELETTERMREGTADLQQAGKLARYWTIPRAGHGDFGPEAVPLVNEVFDWLLRVAPDDWHEPSAADDSHPSNG